MTQEFKIIDINIFGHIYSSDYNAMIAYRLNGKSGIANIDIDFTNKTISIPFTQHKGVKVSSLLRKSVKELEKTYFN